MQFEPANVLSLTLLLLTFNHLRHPNAGLFPRSRTWHSIAHLYQFIIFSHLDISLVFVASFLFCELMSSIHLLSHWIPLHGQTRREWDRWWCFDVHFILSFAEHSCDGQVLHKNNSGKDGWTFGSACRGECLSVVGLSVSLNPVFNPYLVVWKLENFGMAPLNRNLRWVVVDWPHNTVPYFV